MLESGAMNGELNSIEIKKTSNPGTELTKVFSLLDKASVPGFLSSFSLFSEDFMSENREQPQAQERESL